MTAKSSKARCFWAGDDPLMVRYHDREWGRPSRDERHLFEMLTLELFQSGLAWSTILRKREGFRQAFAAFDVERVARFGERDVARLLADASIVRNRAKIAATLANARVTRDLARGGGALARLLWSFTAGKTLRDPAGMTRERLPATRPESHAMAAELKRRGFRFVGPTTCYSLMQAVGMVDDHVAGCFRYRPRLQPPPRAS